LGRGDEESTAPESGKDRLACRCDPQGVVNVTSSA
jgi:hypothetical protein